MQKRALAFLCLFILVLTSACASKDKAELLGWMKNLNAENAPVSIWSSADFAKEQVLTAEEAKAFYTILQSLTEDDITENKHLAGITPEYGFHLVVEHQDDYINQADAPHGQFEISYQHKLWWIESGELKALYIAVSS